MKLSDKQKLFARLLPTLINKAHELGYEVTLGDAYRDPRAFGRMGERETYGHKNSCHKIRLAIDLNLFLKGKYLTETEDHRQLGLWWEKQHMLCTWGGRFNDGNHYSFEHNGNK